MAPLLNACTLYLARGENTAAAPSARAALVQPGPQRVHVDGLRAEAVGDVGVEGCGAVGALLVAVEHVAAGGREQVRVEIFRLLAPRQNHAQLARAQRPGDGESAMLRAAVVHFHGLGVVKAFQASNVVNAHNVLASRDPELELAGGRRHHAAEHLLVGHNVDSGAPYKGSVGGLAHNTLQNAVKLVQLGRLAVLAWCSASTGAACGSGKTGSAVDAVLARLAVRSGGTCSRNKTTKGSQRGAVSPGTPCRPSSPLAPGKPLGPTSPCVPGKP